MKIIVDQYVGSIQKKPEYCFGATLGIQNKDSYT